MTLSSHHQLGEQQPTFGWLERWPAARIGATNQYKTKTHMTHTSRNMYTFIRTREFERSVREVKKEKEKKKNVGMNRQESEIYDVFHPMGFNKTREEEEKQQPNSNQVKRSSSSSPSSPPSTTKKKQNIHRRLEKLSCIMWTCVSLSIAAWMTRQEEDGRHRDLSSLLYSIRYSIKLYYYYYKYFIV